MAEGQVTARFSTNKHAIVTILIFAYGPGSELLTSIYQNTEIYTRIRQALGWK